MKQLRVGEEWMAVEIHTVIFELEESYPMLSSSLLCDARLSCEVPRPPLPQHLAAQEPGCAINPS